MTWTPEEAAVFLKVTPKTVRLWAAAGKLPAFKLGRLWRFDEVLLRDWVDAKVKENLAPEGPTQRLNLPPFRVLPVGHRTLAERLGEQLRELRGRPESEPEAGEQAARKAGNRKPPIKKRTKR
jgi:excisionase family DNA binding protein